jgi:hypothetical protein
VKRVTWILVGVPALSQQIKTEKRGNFGLLFLLILVPGGTILFFKYSLWKALLYIGFGQKKKIVLGQKNFS